MLEQNYSGLNPSGKFNLQTSTSKLLINAVFPASNNSDQQSIAFFLITWGQVTANTLVSATRFSEAKGTKEIFTKMNLLDLAEIAAQNEGFIHATLKANDITGIWEWTVRFSIELSNAGAVGLSQKDFITMQFAGFDLFSKFEIHSIGAAVEFDEHLKISPVSCAAGAQIKFSCLSHYGVVVPSTLSKLQLMYLNGLTQQIEGTELSLIAPDVNEITYVIMGQIVPFNKWRFFPIPTADRAIVSLTDVGFCYLLSNKNYE